MSAAKAVKAWRLARQLSQRECAERCGVSQNAWSHIELGKMKPGRDFSADIQRLTRGAVKAGDWK